MVYTYNESKKWVSITGLCNNNCLFCLDRDRKDKYHKSYDEVIKTIDDGIKEGCQRLVLSGGEPTIHPDIVDFVKYGKEVGYKKIQIITNGRMFASKKFSDKIVEAGLDEVTFSIHGHNAELHDSLTNVKGSFIQAIKGLLYLRKNTNLILNLDVCVNKLNYRFILDILKFFVEKMAILEINFMNLVPFGNAWLNKDLLFYTYEEVLPFLRQSIDYSKHNNVYLWFSRFPSKYFERYEQYIEDTNKLYDDLLGMGKDALVNKPCKGERCYFCGVQSVCNLFNQDNNIDYINNIEEDRLGISYSVGNRRCFSFFIDNNFCLDKDKLKVNLEIDWDSYDAISGIPFCFVPALYHDKLVNDIVYESLDFNKRAKEISSKAKTKSLRCQDCKYNNVCDGVYVEYIRKFGFSRIKPII